MSLVVTGSIGIDSVETPNGKAENVLGGSGIYFSLAASLYTNVRLVGVVGEDFDHSLLEVFQGKTIDTAGIEQRKGSKTFRWQGRYQGTMNDAETVGVELNVLAEHGAPIPDAYRDSQYVFLANTHPDLQRSVAEQFGGAKLIVCDTMNLWIENERDSLLKTLKAVHGVVLNEGEARLLTGLDNLVAAGRAILKLGPRIVVIKKGEHGSILFTGDDLFVLPAFPTENTVDPTGCGDTYAGAMMGYLAKHDSQVPALLRAGLARGCVAAATVIESFSVHALAALTPDDVEARVQQLREMLSFD